MNKIEIIYNSNSYSFLIEKYKVILGNDCMNKFNMLKCIKQYFYKSQYSDYSNEYLNKTILKIDDRHVDVRNTFYYELSSNYDLCADQKMSTKSLILKYLEVCLENIEYNEEFNTIKVLLENFVSMTLEEIVDLKINDNMNFELKLSEMNYKTIIKLVEPLMLKDSLEINNYDLTYEEIYLIQLKLIDRIARKSNKKVFVVADIPFLTSNIIEKIDTLENTLLIIFSNTYSNIIKIEKYVISDLEMLDMQDDERINDYTMNLPWHLTINQFKDKLKESLKKFCLKQLFINKII